MKPEAPAPGQPLPPAEVTEPKNAESGGVDPEEPDVGALIERFDNDSDLLAELGELFLKQNPQLLARIADAIRAADANRLEHAAHSLKGSLLNLCAPHTAQYAGRLEAMGAKRQLTGAEDACAVLAEKMAPMVERLRRIVAEHSGKPEAVADDAKPR